MTLMALTTTSSPIVLNFMEALSEICVQMKVTFPRIVSDRTQRAHLSEFRAIIRGVTGCVSLGFIHTRQFDRDGLRVRDKSHYARITPRLSRKIVRYFRHGAVWFTSHRRCIINRPVRTMSIINRITGHAAEISLRRYVLPAGLTVINGAKLHSLSLIPEVKCRRGALANRSSYQNFKNGDNAAEIAFGARGSDYSEIRDS